MNPREKRDYLEKQRKRKYAAVIILVLIASLIMLFSMFGKVKNTPMELDPQEEKTAQEEVKKENVISGHNEDYQYDYERNQDAVGVKQGEAFDYSFVPPFNQDKPYYVLNGNKPYFNTDNISPESYEDYSKLDELGRVGICEAVIGKDLMPTEKRGPIGMVKPSGWNQKRYDDIIQDKYLYNRCHLIGFQLAGENANPNNLMTGTRYFNVIGMLPFENLVADTVISKNIHVKLKTTPVFIEDDLVARGLIMEGYSIEDNGKSVCFNVFVYNNQPGVDINYKDGSSKRNGETVKEQTIKDFTDSSKNKEKAKYSEKEKYKEASSNKPKENPVKEKSTVKKENKNVEALYIGNKKTKVFHKADCESVKSIKKNNLIKKDNKSFFETEGYRPCKRCNP